jgi:hypothetical protein
MSCQAVAEHVAANLPGAVLIDYNGTPAVEYKGLLAVSIASTGSLIVKRKGSGALGVYDKTDPPAAKKLRIAIGNADLAVFG